MLLATLVPADEAAAQRVTIEGRVWADRDGDGRDPATAEPPLAGVQVILFRDGRQVDATRTDEAGRYRFRGLRTGAYKVAIDESTLPEDLGLGPASFLERNYVDTTRSVADADFGFVPHAVIAELRAAAAAPGPTAEPGQAVPATEPGRPATPPGLEPRAPELRSADEMPRPADEPPPSRPRPGGRAAVWILAILAAVLVLAWLLRRLFAKPQEREAAPEATDPDQMIELFLDYRDAQAWSEMDALYRAMPEPVRELTIVRQQRAFQLNRAGDHDAAERLLREHMAEEGVSPESCGLMGRVFKDRWEEAHRAGDEERAGTMHARALEHYLAGHDADPSDPYPGINALTLMEWEASPPDRRDSLVTELGQAIAMRTSSAAATYWDHATRLEYSILLGDQAAAGEALEAALAAPKTPWQVETTHRNLRILREGRERKGEAMPDWAREAEQRLAAAQTES